MSRTSPAPSDAIRIDYGALRAKRRFLDRSQKQVAEAVGVHWHTISRLERGRTEPSLKLMVLIARDLGTPLHQLFSVSDDSPA